MHVENEVEVQPTTENGMVEVREVQGATVKFADIINFNGILSKCKVVSLNASKINKFLVLRGSIKSCLNVFDEHVSLLMTSYGAEKLPNGTYNLSIGADSKEAFQAKQTEINIKYDEILNLTVATSSIAPTNFLSIDDIRSICDDKTELSSLEILNSWLGN